MASASFGARERQRPAVLGAAFLRPSRLILPAFSVAPAPRRSKISVLILAVPAAGTRFVGARKRYPPRRKVRRNACRSLRRTFATVWTFATAQPPSGCRTVRRFGITYAVGNGAVKPKVRRNPTVSKVGLTGQLVGFRRTLAGVGKSPTDRRAGFSVGLWVFCSLGGGYRFRGFW